MTLALLLLTLAALPASAEAASRPDAAAARPWAGGDVDRALSLLEASPPSRERDLNRTVVLLYAGRMPEAETLLDQLLARDARWVPAQRWSARLRHELGRYEAVETTTALLRSREAGVQDALWAGHVFLEQREPGLAQASYVSAVQRAPDLSLGWLGLQQAETALEHPEAARQAGLRAHGFTAADGEAPSLLLFPGEKLRYRVKYLCLRLAELTIATSDVPERPGVRRVVLTARSNPSIPFFHIDSSFESLVGADGRLLTHGNLTSESDSGRHTARYEMNGAARRCTVRWVREGLFGYDVLPLPDQPQDGITVMLLMRALAGSGGAVTVPTAVDETWRPTTLKTLGPETIHWRGRTIEVVHMQSTGDYRGPGGLSGVVDVWVSADERAIPYKARMKVAVGSVCLELLPDRGRGKEESARGAREEEEQ